MDIVLAILAVILAMVIGFAVHRAGLCNVKAVAELISTKRAHMLGSFLKTVLWVIAVTFVIEFFFRPGSTWPLQLWGFGFGALAGGFVFGIGAAINGGCALGTLGRLGNGDLRMLLTLLGGVLLSSLTRRSFVLDWRFRLDWLRNLFGGILMGVGVTMAPGGNDVLIFHAIPSGSPHALPAYAALLVGTAAGLLVIRMLGGTVTEVECTGDVCRIRTVPNG